MVKTPEELFALIDGLRARGVTHFRLEGLEFTVLPKLPGDEDFDFKFPESLSAEDTGNIPDHILFASSE